MENLYKSARTGFGKKKKKSVFLLFTNFTNCSSVLNTLTL